MPLASYEHRDPSLLVEAVATRYQLTRPAAYLVVVEDPPGEQRVVHLRKLRAPALLIDWEVACKELRERLEALPLAHPRRADGSPGPNHAATVVVVRRGICVAGPNEGQWCRAWRYSNVFAPIFSHGLILVTEHGWHDLDTHWGDTAPALAPSGRPNGDRRLRAV